MLLVTCNDISRITKSWRLGVGLVPVVLDSIRNNGIQNFCFEKAYSSFNSCSLHPSSPIFQILNMTVVFLQEMHPPNTRPRRPERQNPIRHLPSSISHTHPLSYIISQRYCALKYLENLPPSSITCICPFVPFLTTAFEYSPSASLSTSIPNPLKTFNFNVISSSTMPLLRFSPPSTPCASSSCKRAWRSASWDERRSDSISRSLADLATRNFWVSRVAISEACAVEE